MSKIPETIVVICGLPSVIEQHFKRDIGSLMHGKRDILYHTLPPPYRYTKEFLQEVYANLADRLKAILSATPSDQPIPSRFLGVLVFFMDFKTGQDDLIADFFNVEALVSKIEFQSHDLLHSAWPNRLGVLKNEIVGPLRKMIRERERALKFLRRELTSNDNRTPLLLPIHNFGKDAIRPLIDEVQSKCGRDNEADEIRQATKGFETSFPRQRHQDDPKRHFCNAGGLVFRSPGKARHRFPHSADENHPSDVCWMRGRLRLGVGYDPQFHYDCVPMKSGMALKKRWPSCHGQTITLQPGRFHANIAPNDRVG